jgi:hypothetical protein
LSPFTADVLSSNKHMPNSIVPGSVDDQEDERGGAVAWAANGAALELLGAAATIGCGDGGGSEQGLEAMRRCGDGSRFSARQNEMLGQLIRVGLEKY